MHYRNDGGSFYGDFKAEVGNRNAEENDTSVGIHDLNDANEPGQKQWASSEQLCISNIFFTQRPQYRTTYIEPSVRPR